MIKGAIRTIRDKQGKTPAELAKENNYVNILKMLNESSGVAESCNFRQTLKPMKKKKKTLFFFFLIFFGLNALVFLFSFPFIDGEAVKAFYFLFNLCSFLSFLASWLKDPGYQKRNPAVTLLVKN